VVSDVSYIPDLYKLISVANSTVAPLGANQTFIGIAEDVSDYSSISINLWTDQKSLTDGIRMEFSPDGIAWDKVKPHTATAGKDHNFLLTVITRYFRMVFTNGAIAQTTFRLQVIYHKYKNKAISFRVDEPIDTDEYTELSRSVLVGASAGGGHFSNVEVDSKSNLSVHIDEPKTAFGEVQVAERTPQAQINFVYGVNTEMVDVNISGSGSVTQVNGNAEISTGAAANSSADVVSKKLLKIRPGQGMEIVFSALFDIPAAGSEQAGGAGTQSNGHFFAYDGVDFGVLRLDNNVDNWTRQVDWNIDKLDGTGPSGMILDPTKGNVYKIVFQWLGYGAINYYVESDLTGNFIPVHINAYANKYVTPNVRIPSFPLHFYALNTTNTTNIVMRTASSGGFIEGQPKLTGPRNSQFGSKQSIGTGGVNIITLRNKSLYLGLENDIASYLSFISAAIDGAKPGFMTIVANATLGGTPIFKDVEPNNSTMQFDVDGTTVTGGKEIALIAIAAAASIVMRFSDFEYQVLPGDDLTFMMTATSGNTDALISVGWTEDF